MKVCYRFFLIGFAVILFSATPMAVFSQNSNPPFISKSSEAWADSVLKSLSYEDRIGQLFMVDAYSNRDSTHIQQITRLIKEYHIGGLIFFQGGPVRQAIQTNYYQSVSKVPLMIGIDGEWGLSMRLDSTIRFPRQMTLSASASDSLVYKIGSAIARQCKRMGIQINFAPVADVNNNPQNPVINTRSFGDDPSEVTRMSSNYMHALQEQHVLACVKHFPGHGDTDADSHLALPMISKKREALDSVELVPFRKLLSDGAASVMVAHLFIPALDTTPNLASSLSAPVVTGLLKNELHFNGLVFTDALNMKGVADYYPPGEIALMALNAGNDVLLFSADVPAAFTRLHYAIQNCELDQEAVDSRVKKILMAKYWSGLNNYSPVDTAGLTDDLNNETEGYLAREAFESAITVLENHEHCIPVSNVLPGTIAAIEIGDSVMNPFQQTLNRYAPVNCYGLPMNFSTENGDSLLKVLESYNTVILSVHNIFTKASLRYGITDTLPAFIESLRKKTKLITVVFGNSYSLTRLDQAMAGAGLVISYEDTYWPQIATAQVLFGGERASGDLPVAVSADFTKGSGLKSTDPITRLGFSTVEAGGLHEGALHAIDSLAAKAINEKVTPGCQVLVAKSGTVIYEKSFGTFDYDSSRMVQNSDLYDIASVTKMAATALAVMRLYEYHKIDITKKASHYLPELKKTALKNCLIADILTHQAGLKAWIPFWKETMENGKPAYNIYHPEKDVNYTIPVTDSLFMLSLYKDFVWEGVLKSEVTSPGNYVYSDLGMLIMQRMVEHITGKSLDEYLEEEFYRPMGIYRLCFNPLNHFPVSRIAPTENDTSFRKQQIRGTVHDPAAALMGGVAGNAGLFSDASSLAMLMQMLLNGGEYGGHRYLEQSTVDLFTKRYFTNSLNRRGLIFDKPESSPGKESPAARSASPATFGHTGFTGTCAWADPENDLVFIFLSNRVYPDATNNKLAKGNYRTDMMEAVYKAFNLERR